MNCKMASLNCRHACLCVSDASTRISLIVGMFRSMLTNDDEKFDAGSVMIAAA